MIVQKIFDLPVVSFKTQAEWRKWLTKNHTNEKGVWLRMYKKASGVKSIVYREALDEALCYGWIDGQVNKYDEESYVQRFTPRRSRSLWSKRNTENIARLTKLGKMKPAGLVEVQRAKDDGRWKNAYGAQKNTVIPEDFLKELDKHPKAKAFFQTLNKSNLFVIAYRLETAKKPETRVRRMKAMIELFNQEKTFYD